MVLFKKVSVSSLFRFCVTGGLSTGVQYGLLYGLTRSIGLAYLESSVIAFIVHVAVKFLLQKFWTFENSDLKDVSHQLGYYLSMEFMNLGINTAFMYGLVRYLHLQYFSAQCLLTVFLSIEGFLVSRWIFRLRISV